MRGAPATDLLMRAVNGPLGAGWFEDRMSRLGPWVGGDIAIAVSGGADSLALAWLVKRWQSDGVADRPAGLRGLIVDHGLRAESAGEAELTRTRLLKLGIPANILSITGLKAGSALAARAREARYAILREASRRYGIVDLLLGHHADDQAETVAMRIDAGSGGRGLSGMASIVELNNVRLVRPLLECPSWLLRDTLRTAGLEWVEDPSNADVTYTRARVRMRLRPDSTATRRLSVQARRAGDERMRAETITARRLAIGVRWTSFGAACLTGSPDSLEPADAAALIRVIGGAAWPPGEAAVHAFLRRMPTGATVGGVRAVQGRDGLWLCREGAACEGRVPASEGVIWDRRFRQIGVAPLGTSVGALGTARRPESRMRDWPAAALRAGLPALWSGERVLAIPHLGWARPGLKEIAFSPVRTEPLIRQALYENIAGTDEK